MIGGTSRPGHLLGRLTRLAMGRRAQSEDTTPPVGAAEEGRLEMRSVGVSYGATPVLAAISMVVQPRLTTVLVGPPGCGLSTILRTYNRMTELAPDARVTGQVLLDGHDIYGPGVRVESIRRRISMIFPDPQPFPMAISTSVALGWRFQGAKKIQMAEVVERSLRQVGLWEEVKDRLHHSALSLREDRVQRLCLACALAVNPEALLFDEPAVGLYGQPAPAIEDLVSDLRTRYTIVVATHNLLQAARLADNAGIVLGGKLVEFGPASSLFSSPRDPRAAAYITRHGE